MPHSVYFLTKYFGITNKCSIFATERISYGKKYKTKEELIAAFKHAVGAKDAFESLVKGKMSKADFEKQGYRLAEII